MNNSFLIFDGDEPIDQVALEDDMADMELAADGDDEEEAMDAAEVPDDAEDDEFKLDGFDTLGVIEEDDDEEGANDYDPEYDDAIAEQKRKRVKPTATNLQRGAMYTQTAKAEAFILDEDTVFSAKPTSRVPGTFGRRNRRKGETLPAYHKRVSHELDSDDEMMMAMREKGFSDRQIADKLAKDGRIRYDQKSISTRIMRIRLAQAENVDFLLREGYKEWEFEDDSLLMQANALADIEINYDIERIRAWRFRKVSDYMRRLNKDALYSATACRDRYNVLVNGTASIPTEIDDDPDTRRIELELFRESREQVRNKERDEHDAKEAIDRKAKDAAKTRNAQKAEEIAYKRQQKEEEKAQRAMQRAAAAQARSQRAGENAIAKAQRNAQLKKQKIASDKKIAKGKGKPEESAIPDATLTFTNTEITADTPDPRGHLSMHDLSKMCADRGIRPTGKDKAQLLSDIQDADSEWTVQDLKKMCRSKSLDGSGSMMSMRYRLALAAAQVCTSFRAGVGAETEAGERMDEEE